MAADSVAIAPAPPGVQTFDKVGPKSSGGTFADKFHTEFAKLRKAEREAAEAPPSEEPKNEVKVEQTPAEPAKDTTPSAPVSEPEADVKPQDRPTSPLDALIGDKKEEKAEAADDIKDLDQVSTPTKENWQKAREGLKKREATIQELNDKLKQLSTTPKVEPSVVDELTKQRDEIQAKFQEQENRLKAINAEYSDDFQNLIKAKETDLNKIAKKMAAFGGDADALVGVLALPEGKVRREQMKAVMAEMEPDDKLEIKALIQKIDDHDEKITEFRANSTQRWDELVSKRDAQMAEQNVQAIKQLEQQYGKIVETIPSSNVTLKELPEDAPGAVEWNNEVREAIARGLTVLKPGGADFDQSVQIAVKGARYDSLEKRLLATHAELRDARKRLAEYDGNGPDFKGTPKVAGNKDTKTAAQKYHDALAKIGQGQLTDF